MEESDKIASDMESMKIAFRYSNLPSRFDVESCEETKRFDFGTYLDGSLLERASIEFHHPREVLQVLQRLAESAAPGRPVTRIWIDELGSPLIDLPTERLPGLAHQIRVLMRRLSNSVAVATVVSADGDDLLEPSVRTALHFEADCVVRVVGFDDQDPASNPYQADYVGFLHLLRLPRLNSLTPYNPELESTEFGIQLRNSKRYLTVAKLSLPPDLSETVSRFSTSNKQPESIVGCGGGHAPSQSTEFF